MFNQIKQTMDLDSHFYFNHTECYKCLHVSVIEATLFTQITLSFFPLVLRLISVFVVVFFSLWGSSKKYSHSSSSALKDFGSRSPVLPIHMYAFVSVCSSAVSSSFLVLSLPHRFMQLLLLLVFIGERLLL